MARDLSQHNRALELIEVFRTTSEVFHGYLVAAAAIGWEGDVARPMGQVTSRVDLGCFYGGLPMLATHRVRKPDGSINPSLWVDATFGPYHDEIMNLSINHVWTEDDFKKLMVAMSRLQKTAANAQWQEVITRESKSPGFVRYNLHRNVEFGSMEVKQ